MQPKSLSPATGQGAAKQPVPAAAPAASVPTPQQPLPPREPGHPGRPSAGPPPLPTARVPAPGGYLSAQPSANLGKPYPEPVVARNDLPGPAPAERAPANPAMPIAAQVTEALMGTYWGHRPGDRGAPASRGSNPLATRPVDAGLSALTPASDKNPITVPPPRSLSADLDAGPNERELEAMQNLIQQLAVQLNGSRAADDGPAPYAVTKIEAPSEAALVHSLAALRATATTMRQDPLAKTEPADTVALQLSPVEASGSDHSAMPTADAAPPAEAAAPEAAAATASLSRPPALPEPAAHDAEPVSPYAQIARIAEAVAADRVEVYLDPILALADRKARLFEVSVRLRASEGDVLDPAAIRNVASGTGLLARIDAAKLARSARVAARLRTRGTSASL